MAKACAELGHEGGQALPGRGSVCVAALVQARAGSAADAASPSASPAASVADQSLEPVANMKTLVSECSNSGSEAIAAGLSAGTDWPNSTGTAASKSPTGAVQRPEDEHSGHSRAASPSSPPADLNHEQGLGLVTPALTHRDAASQTVDLPPAPSCDIDTFLASVTPVISCHKHTSSDELTLQDLWDWFLEPGLFGHRVETEGCRFGPSSAFFVPLLSAMRLFSCHATAEAAAQAQEDAPHLDSVEQCRCIYAGADDAPAQVQLLALHNNRKLPWERLPLHQEVEALAEQEPTTSIPCPHALGTTRLADVHPSSWLAVWWQPLYRIPEMPLEAKFLVYYSFKGLAAGQRAAVALPVAGMLCSAAQGPLAASTDEQWAQVHARVAGGFMAAPREVHKAQQRANGMLRDLHTAAQQLTCDCGGGVRVLRPDGGAMEDEAHRDFAFLQRGRMGPGGAA